MRGALHPVEPLVLVATVRYHGLTAAAPPCCDAPRVAAGILGLAHEWNAVNPTYIPTLYHNLVKDKQVRACVRGLGRVAAQEPLAL